MTLIMIEVEDVQAAHEIVDLMIASAMRPITMTIDPSVYVVNVELDDPVVFWNEEDAQGFAETSSNPLPGYARLLVCDETTAAEIIAGRQDDEDDAGSPFDVNLKLEGVHWTGHAGDPVERDDESGRFPGDLEAALYVAEASGFPFLLYSEMERGEDRLWEVTVYPTREAALVDYEPLLRDSYRDHDGPRYICAFVFKATLKPSDLVAGPDGNGYRLPQTGASAISSAYFELFR